MLNALSLLALAGNTHPRQDDADLITGGNFEQPLSSDWSYTGLKISFGESKQRKARKFIQITQIAGAKAPGVGVLQVKSSGLVHIGDTLYFRAWVRNASPSQDLRQLQAELGPTNSVEKTLFDRKVSVTHEWREVKFAAATDDFYLPGSLTLTVKLQPGESLEVSNLRLLDVGDTPVSSLSQTTDKSSKSHSKSKDPGQSP